VVAYARVPQAHAAHAERTECPLERIVGEGEQMRPGERAEPEMDDADREFRPRIAPAADLAAELLDGGLAKSIHAPSSPRRAAARRRTVQAIIRRLRIQVR
jgi:hypothetical protein